MQFLSYSIVEICILKLGFACGYNKHPMIYILDMFDCLITFEKRVCNANQEKN